LGLNLQGNTIEINGAQYLAEALKNCELLQYLNLNGNKIQTDGAMNVTELLFSHKKLLELNLGNNDINHDGVIGILSVLNCSNYTLEMLNIDNPDYSTICQSTAIHFGKMFQNNLGIQKLSMQKHKMRCAGVFTIMEYLLENNTLRVLHLTANDIRFQGCESIAKYLKSETWTLESLHLGANEWGNYGAKAIAQALPVNKSLIHLDMSHNQIEDFGLMQLAQALGENSTIMSIKFFGNNFDQDSLDLFYELFRQERENQWYPDFIVYIVDTHYEMAYLETALDMDIYAS
jgi:Ran GTPase-activating protein (RanGAP) involved in mRNA processing and transport